MRRLLHILAYVFLLTMLLSAGILIGLSLAGCKPSPPPKPKPAPTDTLVIVQGGLGADQTAALADAIRTRCPRALVLSVGTWDAYKVDPRPIITTNARAHLVMIRHSFAAYWCSQPMPSEDYDVELDPVSPGGAGLTFWGDLPAPVAARVDVFWRADLVGPRVARMPGIAPIIVPGGHNAVPHDAGMTDRVCLTINGL